MAKSTTGKSKQFRRLLNLFFLVQVLSVSTLYAAPLSQSYTEGLQFTSQDGYFFTDRECLYSLEIPEVNPDEVQVFLDTSFENIQFISSKKSDWVSSQNGLSRIEGTLVQVRIQFAKPGVYELAPCFIRIQNREYRIPFEKVTVYQNPQTIMPEVSVKFANPIFNSTAPYITAETGEHLDFTVYIKYAVQVVGFSWELPQNSLFEELTEYEITEGKTRGTEFSPEAVPVATFRWQPLTEGTFSLPQINLKVTAYNGSRVDLTFPTYSFTITPPSEQKANDVQTQNMSVFAYAFTPPPQEPEQQVKEYVLDEETYKLLLDLRSLEKHSLPNTKVTKVRKELEQIYSLSSNKNEASIPLFIIFCTLSVITILLAVLFFVFRHIPLGAVFLSLAVLASTVSIFNAVYICEPAALFKGGELCTIPEAQVYQGVFLQPGSRVKIKQSAGGWVYIEYKELTGWVKDSEIDYIR